MRHFLRVSILGTIIAEKLVLATREQESYISLYVQIKNRHYTEKVNVLLYGQARDWFIQNFVNVNRTSRGFVLSLTDQDYKPTKNSIYCNNCSRLLIIQPNMVELLEND